MGLAFFRATLPDRILEILPGCIARTAPPPSAVDDIVAALQTALGDAYVIQRELPAGGMSRLVLATDTSAFGRPVVIKVLPPDMVSTQSTARFKREVDVTAHLQHPNILPVLGAGAREGLLYYIMPYVEGESLRRRMERGERYSVVAALRLLREIADAIAYANERGVIHRDIKPENILLSAEHALVADFGIARGAINPMSGGEAVTATGVSLGTLGYMAPEQLFGSAVPDARVDIYSLGVLAYEVLAGRAPFSAVSGLDLAKAHLQEVPKPLSTVAPAVPLAVSDAIAKALEKLPDKRQQSASELRDVFESAIALLQSGAVARQPEPPPMKRRLRAVAYVAAVAVVSAVVGVAVWSRRPVADETNRDRILVVPFNLPDGGRFTSWDGADLWSQTLLNVVTRSLDGVGPLTTVDAASVLRDWKGRGDAESARAEARDHDAGLAVYGEIVIAGGDSLVARAQLLDVESGKTIDSVFVAGEEDRPDKLAASLALGILDVLRKVRPVTATPNAGLGSRSPPAVKEFAKGEGFYRRTQWDSALAHYERAIAIDSTFALALRRAGQSVAWLRHSDDSLARAYLRQAGALNRNLGRHDSLLIAADSLSSTLPDDYADPRWLPQARRLFAVLNTAVRLYPSDPEVWFARGDAGYHYGYGPGVGIGDRQELSDFSRAIRLNRGFAPAYQHVVELAFSLDLPDTARTYAEWYLALNSRREDVSTIGMALRIADYATQQSAALDFLLDTADASQLASAWLILRRWPDSQETAVRIARALVKREHRDALFPDPRVRLSLQLAYRGHTREAGMLWKALGDIRASLAVDYALVEAFPRDSATARFDRWLEDYAADHSRPFPWWTLPWWVRERDVARIERIASMADEEARDRDVQRARIGSYAARAARGYLALARGDSTGALAILRALPDSLCVDCYQERVQAARLMATLDEPERAALLLDERPNRLLTPTEIPIALERARVARQMQRDEKALENYSLVASAWAKADASLAAIVTEAREAAAALRTRVQGAASGS